MGIFDIFDGSRAAGAADQNAVRLAQLQTSGMGALTDGRNNAISSIDSAKNYFAPLSSLASKYGAGTDLYLDALGTNGAAGNARATSAFQSSPGYEFGVNQSLDALDRRAASRGLLGSGNNTIDTLKTVHGLADQDYGSWMDRLGGLISPELSATSGSAGSLAGLEASKAPIYTNDANSRIALQSGVANGINSQSTQAANADMAASGNLWNFGLNAAKLAAGAAGGAGGIGSMLGGGAGANSLGGAAATKPW